ncbi:MAG: hypothetical protein ACM34C_00975, partial [Syntrophaceae bacterium]
MRPFSILAASSVALLLFSACTAVRSQSEFNRPAILSSTDNIVLLSNLSSDHDFNDKDVDRCIRPSMLEAAPELHFLSAKHFREKLYPYFTPSTTPHDLEGYKSVLDKPEVQQRIDSLGVRYLIILRKGGRNEDWHGGILCGAGYGGGGCLGLSWWDRKSELGLGIWHLKDKSHAASGQGDPP